MDNEENEKNNFFFFGKCKTLNDILSIPSVKDNLREMYQTVEISNKRVSKLEDLKDNFECFNKSKVSINKYKKKSESILMNSKPNSNKREFEHYNRWLTDNIQNYIKNINRKIWFLFKPYVFFIEMSLFFGLSKTYLKVQRKSEFSKKVIAADILERMRLSLKMNIEKWTKTYSYLSDLLLKAQRDILGFIDEYENKLNPKPSSHYKMYINHPNFVRDFFKVINTKEKAYWLGFLFADGYIGIEKTNSGNYYRMGLELSEKDRILIEKFCNTIGLNLKHVKIRIRLHAYTKKKYRICLIRWGDQDFANDLLNHGMEYEFNDEKGKRVKTMKFPDFLNYDLMLAFILGYYDGDGSLGLKKGKKRDSIYPEIKSSNKDFLLEIKDYFKIKSEIKSKVEDKYDFVRDRIFTSKMYSLYLGIELFREMLQNYKYSLERKRIPLERIKQYGISPVKYWLIKILPKEVLRKILKFISPYKIGEMLGVRVETIYSLVTDVYGFEIPFSRDQYIRLKQLINNRGESSQFFKEYNYWLKFLEKLGKFENS